MYSVAVINDLSSVYRLYKLPDVIRRRFP